MDKKTYHTNDLNVATALLAVGCDIDGIDPSDPDRVIFLFDMDKYPEIETLVSRFWNGSLASDIKGVLNTRRDLITRVKEARRYLGD